ncbi:MAG: alpha-glucosidase/alpha-galactosidase [Spirochaetia bacterium]
MFKAAFIGAGSVGFTRKLVGDLLTVPEFKNINIAFMDIKKDNLERVMTLVKRDLEANGMDEVTLTSHTDRREALMGADYVFNVIRVGGMDAFSLDIEIPLKYGIDQCVGDTLCAGGIMYGQRGIPVILDICKDIREVSNPDCLLLNYANPNAMMTWAANKYGGVKTVGLCHGVQGGHRQIAMALGIPKEELEYECVGINHQTWFVKLLYKGQDMTGKVLEAYENHPELSIKEKVRIDMLKRFGYYSTESNGHLSEYLAWYRKRPEEIQQWIDMESWTGGETGGYLRICTEKRTWFKEDFPRWLKEPPMEYKPENRSSEHGSYIVEGLRTGRVYRGHFNVVNSGCITNLPDDAIVEVPGYVDATGMHIPVYGELPLGCAAVCSSSIQVQRLAVEAAVHGNDTYLRQAMMLDPLTGAVCNPPEIWQLTDDMLIAQAQWLPQYASAIEEAKKRQQSGKRLPVNEDYRGAARVQLKSVEELRKEDAEKTMNAEESAMGLKKGEKKI